MTPGEWGRWSAALGLALVIHATAFLPRGTQTSAEDGEAQRRQGVTKVSFRAIDRPAAVPEQTPQPTPRAKPVPRPKPKPEPAPEPVAEARAKPAPPQLEEPQPAASAAAAAAPSQQAGDTESLARARQTYEAQLMAHIEAHKFYPRAARRRGLAGQVKVSFVVQADGGIEELDCGGAHPVLDQAACEAVNAARPLPTPPAQLSSLFVAFAMAFSLGER